MGLKDLRKKGIRKKFHFVSDMAFGAKQFDGLRLSQIPGISAIGEEKMLSFRIGNFEVCLEVSDFWR